jgi:hypothetical protein
MWQTQKLLATLYRRNSAATRTHNLIFK